MADNDLNEMVEEVVQDSDVITVPIDDTLTNSGEAADAKAVGDALALKADKTELQTKVKVNGQEADNQGLILIYGTDIKVTNNAESPTIAEALEGGVSGGTVKSVNDQLPDEEGNVEIKVVPYADNLRSDDMDQVDDTFLIRTTGGDMGVNGNDAWLLRIRGNSEHTGFVPEVLTMEVIPMERPAPPDITAVLDEATFEAYVGEAGTYEITYDGAEWSHDPDDYGLTISNDPVDGDKITIVWDGENNAEVTVDAAERPAPPEITATIDRDTFVSYVHSSGTTLLIYTTSWSADPALYGITVQNDPVAGDQIKVTYVKEERGTITVADPTSLTATGWNLYNNAAGYARVVKYSTLYGYKIGGIYTSIAFGTTPDAASPTAITPDANGLFSISEDGYVFVTGGNSSDTYILPTWSDWTDGYDGDFQIYKESIINLTNIMADIFPNGLLKAGNVRDEIDFNAKTAINRVSRIPYTAENRAQAEASGLAYEFDENYIYIARATENSRAITIDEAYKVDDHGIEFFAGSVPVYAEIMYGVNLKDKLRRDVITRGMTVSQVKGL